jgi:hypothetical protein
MGEKSEQTQVWIAGVGVVPRDGCELLSANQGAYINFLTLASSEAEYRAKVAGALSYYYLELVEFEDVRHFSPSDGTFMWRSPREARKDALSRSTTRHIT